MENKAPNTEPTPDMEMTPEMEPTPDMEMTPETEPTPEAEPTPEETSSESDAPASQEKKPHDARRRAHSKSRKHRRRRRRRENPALKVINAVLLLLVGLGLAFSAYAGYRYYTFSSEPYDSEIAALKAETASVKSDMEDLQRELKEKDEQMRADLHLAGEKGAAAAEALNKAQAENDELVSKNTELKDRREFLKNIYENTLAYREEYAGRIRQLEDMIVAGKSDVKICYWTFDDGPGQMTSAVLDYCAENGIFVTFFTSREANETGREDVDEPALLRREAMLGNSVQNHTNSHQYSKIAGNLYTRGIDSFREQVQLQNDWILENTGFKPDIFRFPGGSAWAFNLIPKETLEGVLKELGYVWIDWSCDVMDNLHANPDAATVSARATWQSKQIDPPIVVMLSHDWNFNTYYGFMRAVPQLRDQGFVFLPLFSQSWAIGNTVVKFS